MFLWSVEKANPDDFNILSEIARRSKASLGYDEKTIQAWESELAVTREMISNYISFVAKSENRIVGFWCRQAVNGLSDGRLFVLPEEQKKGCGRLLWNAVMLECKNRGLVFLSWETDYKVLPFYLKLGATVVGEKTSDFVPGLKLPIVGVSLS